MEYHPAAAIFPLMDEDDLIELSNDIRAHGLLEPILTHNGKIVDGRNRMAACAQAGVEPRFEDAHISGTVADYVYSKNYHRRHLTEGAKSLAAGRYKLIEAAEAKGRQKKAGEEYGRGKAGKLRENLPEANGRARDKAGERFGVSGKTVDHAAKVLAKASKEVIAAVERNEIAVSTAARLAEAPKAVQKQAIAGGKVAIRKAIETHDATPRDEARNDAGVKWSRAMHDITARLISTRELGGIDELVSRWTPELITQYRDDIAETIKELETWKKALTDKLKKR